MSVEPRHGATSWQRACGAIAVALGTVPALTIRIGEAKPHLLCDAYEQKTVAAVCLAAALMIFLWLARQPRRVEPARLRSTAALVAVAFAGCYALSACFAGPRRLPWDAALRVILPLVLAQSLWMRVPLARAARAAILAVAVAVAALVLAEVTGVVRMLVPEQAFPAATLVHRNNAAFHLAVAVPILLVDLLVERASSRRTLLFGIVIAALFACRSRTAWIAAGCATLVVLLALARDPKRARARALVWAMLSTGAALVAMLALRPTGGLERMSDRLANTLDVGAPSMRERYEIFSSAAAAIAERPLFGWGAATFPVVRPIVDGKKTPGVGRIDPAWSYDPSTGWLAFTRQGGDPGLFVAQAATAASPRRIPLENPLVERPTWCVAGRRLAVQEVVPRFFPSPEHRLSLVDVASGRARTLLETGADTLIARATCSHDGATLAVELVHVGERGYQDELELIDVASGARHTLFRQPGQQLRAVSWSIDDRVLFGMSARCVVQLGVGNGATRSLACDGGANWSYGLPEPASLSPAGDELAVVESVPGACPRLSVIDLASGNARVVRECAVAPAWLPGQAGGLTWVAVRGRRTVEVGNADGTSVEEHAGGEPIAIAPTRDGLLVLDDNPRATRALVWDANGARRTRYAPQARPTPPIADHPHDDVLGVAFEAGLPAAALFVSLLVLLTAAAARALRSRDLARAAWPATMLAFAVLGLTNAPLLLAPSAAQLWLGACSLMEENLE